MSKILIERNPQHALYHLIALFDQVLTAAHPVIPFITEELSPPLQKILGHDYVCLALRKYPTIELADVNTASVDMLMEIVTAVRNIRSMLDISPKVLLTVYMPEDFGARAFLEAEKDMWSFLGKIEDIVFDASSGRCASKILSDNTILKVNIDSIDPVKERDRLHSRKIKLLKEHEKLLEKMQLSHYQEKAPLSIQAADKKLYDHQKIQLEHYTRLISELE